MKPAVVVIHSGDLELERSLCPSCYRLFCDYYEDGDEDRPPVKYLKEV